MMELPRGRCIYLHPIPEILAWTFLDALIDLPSHRVGIMPCCQSDHNGFMPDDEQRLCRSLGTEDDIYRFVWQSSFEGGALVRVGRRGEAVRLHWRRYQFHFSVAEPVRQRLTSQHRIGMSCKSTYTPPNFGISATSTSGIMGWMALRG